MGNYDLVPFDVEKPDQSTAIVKITVPEGLIRPHIRRTTAYYQSRAKIPGFRPGYAPEDLILNRYSADIRSEVIQIVLPDLYRETIEREKLKVVGEPRFDIDWSEFGLPMKVNMILSLRPAVIIADYRDIRLSRPKVEVTPEEVTAFLDHLRIENAELSPPLERAAQTGDILNVTFEKHRPPVVKERRMKLLLDEQKEGDELDTASLIGMKAGDKSEIRITYPADFSAMALAGKTIAYAVIIEDVRERLLSDLDDAFAQDLGAENLDELKSRIREEIRKEKESQIEESLLDQAWHSVLMSSSIEMSPSMVQRFMADFLTEGAQLPPADSQEYKEFYAYTEARLRDYFLTNAVINNEGLIIEAEELTREKEAIQQLVKRRRLSSDEIPDDEELKRRILRHKARQRVKERVQIR